MGVIVWFYGGNRNSTTTFCGTLEPAGGKRDVSTGCWHYYAVFVRRWDCRECLITWLPGSFRTISACNVLISLSERHHSE